MYDIQYKSVINNKAFVITVPFLLNVFHHSTLSLNLANSYSSLKTLLKSHLLQEVGPDFLVWFWSTLLSALINQSLVSSTSLHAL